MKQCPQDGRRIIYTPGSDADWRTPVRGVVIGHYKTLDYDDEGFDWESDEGMPPVRGYTPESEWKVRMKVDRPLPSWWPYGQNDVFCPSVADVEYE